MRYVRVVNRTRGVVVAERAGVAETSAERRTGLLKHTSLAEGEGLWIAPCEAVHTFWMKFPIDLVFLDRRRRVVKVRHGVKPWRISGALTASSVLELPAGTARRTGTLRGDELGFPTER